MRLLALAGAALLAGCASMYGGMSADQITAAAKDKTATLVCEKLIGAGFSSETYVLSLDQKVIANGSVSVGEKCALNITNELPIKVAQPVSPVTFSVVNRQCVRTERDGDGRVTGVFVVDASRCQP